MVSALDHESRWDLIIENSLDKHLRSHERKQIPRIAFEVALRKILRCSTDQSKHVGMGTRELAASGKIEDQSKPNSTSEADRSPNEIRSSVGISI
jgi:hypothetical protein